MESVAELQAQLVSQAAAIDNAWMLVAGCLVFFMQAGFALLESGTVRKKNTANILMKNVIDCAIGAVGWWVLGFGLAFGEDGGGVIGTNNFAITHDANKDLYALWFFQFTFCATAATIVSGALAERCKMSGYVIWSLICSVFLYPIVVHLGWGGGFLSSNGYLDFAGSGIVHLTGGTSALIGAYILGPRIDRFDENKQYEFIPSSINNVCLGTFILWFGWYGFNAGSVAAFSTDYTIAAQACVTTTIAGASGGMTNFLLSTRGRKDLLQVTQFTNGILGGLVSITASADCTEPYAAIMIGLVGGFVVFGAQRLLEILKIDDAISAFPVHGACGMWGVLARGLFDLNAGFLYGYPASTLLAPNIVGILVIVTWCVVVCVPLFGILKKMGLLRVDELEEIDGLDIHYDVNLDPVKMGSMRETSQLSCKDIC